MKKHLYGIYFIFILLFIASCKKEQDTEINEPSNSLEIRGVDMSFLPELRASGVQLKNQNGVIEDALITAKNAGVNVVRLRVWNNNSDPNSSIAILKSIVQEVHNLDMKVMLTVHYSDTWADPAHQTKPSSWANADFQSLTDSVYEFTKLVTRELKPEYIQIGNEINNGFLWPDGSFQNINQFGLLLKSGVKAVRDVDSNAKIIIHFAGLEKADYFFNAISSIDYDIIGLSYYPIWHGKDLDSLSNTLNRLSTTHQKKIFVAETSYPFTFQWNDWTNNVIGDSSQILSKFEASTLGQMNYLNSIKNTLSNTPNGIGFCYWGAEWISFKGPNSTVGSSWENQAFWDFNNRALPVFNCYK